MREFTITTNNNAIDRVYNFFHVENYISSNIDGNNVNGILQQLYSRNYLLSDFSMLPSTAVKDLHNFTLFG